MSEVSEANGVLNIDRKDRTQLDLFFELACIARMDALEKRNVSHNPRWYMMNGVNSDTLKWLSNHGYIGKNIKQRGKKDVYINWASNKQKGLPAIETLDTSLF